MIVVSLLRSVEVNRSNPEKPFAIVVLETDQPLQINEVRLFKNQIDAGLVEKLKPMVGKLVHFPLEVGIFNNRIQYQFPFTGEVRLHAPVQQAQTRTA